MRYDNGYGYGGGRTRSGSRGDAGEMRYGRGGGEPRRPPYGRDYWWLGEREMERHAGAQGYDDAYRRFSESHHPRFTPVGGMYPAMGGSYSTHRPPRPLREPMWFSEWTRWF
jgi:hypothetical protein